MSGKEGDGKNKQAVERVQIEEKQSRGREKDGGGGGERRVDGEEVNESRGEAGQGGGGRGVGGQMSRDGQKRQRRARRGHSRVWVCGVSRRHIWGEACWEA